MGNCAGCPERGDGSLPPPAVNESMGEEDDPLPEDLEVEELAPEAFKERTRNWDKRNLIGEGPTGKVYKAGQMHGRDIVAKTLTSNSQIERDFMQEVNLVRELKDRHVLRLLAYCPTAGSRTMAFEFAHLGSLNSLLHGPAVWLTWEQRIKILQGAAQGLEYLHRRPGGLVHKRIKSTNVLVFHGYVGKISEYKMQSTEQDSVIMGSSLPLGNFAYDAPESFNCELSQKSDVYSFGIVILEALCGRQPMIQQQTIKDWVVSKTNRSPDNMKEVADARLVTSVPEKSLRNLFKLAITCVEGTAAKRPEIRTVVRSLDVIARHD